MEYSTWYDTINLGWFIVYIEGSQVIISNLNWIFSLMVVLAIANSVDRDEIEFLSLKIILAIANCVDRDEIEFLSLKIVLAIANSVDPDEIESIFEDRFNHSKQCRPWWNWISFFEDPFDLH